jgi:hypothetical protein
MMKERDILLGGGRSNGDFNTLHAKTLVFNHGGD